MTKDELTTAQAEVNKQFEQLSTTNTQLNQQVQDNEVEKLKLSGEYRLYQKMLDDLEKPEPDKAPTEGEVVSPITGEVVNG